MKSLVLVIVLFCLLTKVQCRGVNGGMSCAVCTVVSGLVMQLAEIHEESLMISTLRLCNYLPRIAQKDCMGVVSLLENIGTLSSKLTPDLFCYLYGTCTIDDGQEMCSLFPLPFMPSEARSYFDKVTIARIDVCKLPLLKDICNILNYSYTSLEAAQDYDGDGFSLINPLRGADWKGRDCSDFNPETYPGRKPTNFDKKYDSNCNGIWGWNKYLNATWEEILCKDSSQRGLIYLGDSVGAHFHMPEAWINPLIFSWTGLNSTYVLLDELDWPHFGYATGYRNIEPNVLIEGHTDSLYLRLRRKNRCNHRDYQNLSQNGIYSFDGIKVAEAVSRNQDLDHPALVIYGMVGNDVCNRFKDPLPHMTEPSAFKSNVLRTLKILDKKLPNGSHVVLLELVKADFIYDAMAERIHPIGRLHGNVKYKDVYKWLNCMQIGPCASWLNSNETVRQQTLQRTNELIDILVDIATNKKYKHFSVHFVENPINVMWKKVNVPDYLESVDSLHPNQKAQPIMADIVWKALEKLPVDVLGPENKQNDMIKKQFSNQGGH